MANRIPLSDVAEITGGYAFKGADLGSCGYRVVKIAEIAPPRIAVENCERIDPVKVKGLDRFRLNNGDILMAMTGATTGKVGRLWCSEPVYLNQRVAKIFARAGREFDDFIWAVVSQPGFDQKVLANARGSAQPNVSSDGIGRIEIVELSPAQQIVIGGIARSFEDKIEHNRRMALALERLARAIFRAWFVDFEPVKTKAARVTSFPSMSQTVFEALPTRLVDSEIGPLPEGWEIGTVGGMATLSNTQVKPQDYPDEFFDHFSIPAFDAGMRAVVEPGSAIKSGKFLVVEGSVLLSKLNPRIPRVWLPPPPSGRRRIASTEFLVFVPSSTVDRHYLYCQFQQPDFREDLAQGASGTSNSHQRVRPNDLLGRAVVAPPRFIREEFADIVDPLFALSAASHSESIKLAEMRDFLVPQLLSGQVRVSVDAVHSEGGA